MIGKKNVAKTRRTKRQNRSAGGKLRKLKEQKAKAERRAKLIQQKQERTKDTRRKILLGAMLLEKIKRGEIDPDRIRNDLDPFLRRNADRELFGLPPLAQENAHTQ